MLTKKEWIRHCVQHTTAAHICRQQAKQGRSSRIFAKPRAHVYNAHQITLAAVGCLNGKYKVWYVKWNSLHNAITPLLSITVVLNFLGKCLDTPKYYATVSNMSAELETCP